MITTTSTSFVRDVSEIPNLKPPQETFVDDPNSLDDINLEELVFDLKHNIKTLSGLHIYHSIFILSKIIQFTIKLQESPELFLKFRLQQLDKLGISKDEVLNRSTSSDSITSDFSFRSNSPPPQMPPRAISPQPQLKLSTLLSKKQFGRHDVPEPLGQDQLAIGEFESLYDDNIDDIIYDDKDDEIEWLGNPRYIPIEKLIETTDLTKTESAITDLNFLKLKDEIMNHQPKNRHLLKIFNLLKTPALTIDQFLIRIKTYSSNISTCSYLHSGFLLYKLIIYLNNIEITLNNSYRFIVASIRCSTKVIEDVYQKQPIFSNVVGVTLKDLLKIEMGFLYLTNFNLIISEVLLDHFISNEFIDLCFFMKENFPDFYQEIAK
ncbi:hypothetical protein Cantr_01442 [Candida viswanathii]|uniref:Uncharacterized protein n=1 Tax=Candida viswanathii TaxID=5486 RepID=A0A367YIK8_9ASCO|nr:hypothetical protein Cantr_01442 [Candida viswanathii]